MPSLLKAKSADPAIAKRCETLAQSVIDGFGSKLPDLRLLCFFDDNDCQELKGHYGLENRGFYQPLKRGPTGINGWHLLPHYVQESVFPVDSSLHCRKVADHLIYLHGSTCANGTALVMTFAHELQHFVQYGNNRELWAASLVLTNIREPNFYQITNIKWSDIPTELEARIVAKRTGQQLCGIEAVKEHVEVMIAKAVTPDDADDWRFVRDLAVNQPFDLLAQSKLVFRRLRPYRAQIEAALQSARDDSDFKDLDLSGLFDG